MKVQNELVIGSWQEPDNLNAYFTWTASGVWFGMLTLESVMRPDERGGYMPTLLERIPLVSNGDVSPDGKRITYRLRPRIRWADALPLTSADLRFTWEALANPVNDVISHEGFEHVYSIDTPDEHTAVLHLKHPYAAYPMFYMAVFPKHIFGRMTQMNGSAFNYTPSGTGPYYVESWERGVATFYRRNPFYRGLSPYFAGVRLRYFCTQQDLVQALLSKEVDLAINLDIYRLASIEGRRDIRVMQQRSTHIDRITYNLRDPLLRDWEVRSAIDLAIDRDELLHKAFDGLLEEGCSELDGTHWAAPLRLRRFDLDAANGRLEQAGWRRGSDGIRTKDGARLSLTLLTTEGDNVRMVAIKTITGMLLRVGIELQTRFEPTQQFFAMVSGEGHVTEGRFQLCLCSSGMFGDPEPNYREQFHSLLIPGPQNNYSGGNWGAYYNPSVDRWLDEASQSLNEAERRGLYAAIEQTIHDDCPVSYLYKRPIIDACRSDLIGVQHLPYFSVWSQTWSVNEWRLAE